MRRETFIAGLRRAVFCGLTAAALLAFTSTPAHARASASDEDKAPQDVRTMNYTQDVVQKEPSGTALAYFILVGVSILAVGVLFKGSGRTHLD